MRTGVVLAALLAAWPTAAHAQLDVARVSSGPARQASGIGHLGDAILTRDGSRVMFSTSQRLLAEDPDDHHDWYVRAGDLLQPWHPLDLIGQHLVAMTADGSTAVFDGSQRWTTDDTNDGSDVYTIRNGQIQRLTPNDSGAEAVGMSSDGARVLLFSWSRLAADDQNNGNDLYLWEAGAFTRISQSPADAVSGGRLVNFLAQSDDARTVVFSALMQLTPDDTDQQWDVFVWRNGQTAKLEPGNAESAPDFLDMTPDGSKLLFASTERLTGDDTDDQRDAYLATGGSLTRVSTGPSGGNSNDPDHTHTHYAATFLTDDGRRIGLRSRERLTPDDTDSQQDGFLWQDGEVTRVTLGPSGGNADFLGTPTWTRSAGTGLARGAHDGSTLLFSTVEPLTPDDTDGYRRDLYEWRAGEVRRVTTGPTGGNSEYENSCGPNDGLKCGGGLEHVSLDGTRIVFSTIEPLVSEDTDDLVDVYQRAGGVTTLLSPARPGRLADHYVGFADASDDGRVVLLRTEEQLTADDVDEADDYFRVLAPAPGVVVPGAGGTDPGTPGAPGGGGLQGGAALPNAAQPSALLRLLNRPRRLRLARGRARVVRRGHGLRFELPHRARVTVVLQRLRRGRPAVRAARFRLTLPLGRSTIVLGQRLSKRRKLAPGRYRVIVGADLAAHVDLPIRLLAPR